MAARILALAPLLAGTGWALALARFEAVRLDRLGMPAFDTAYFQQLVWGLFHGHFFRASFLSGNFLGLHFSPLLVIPALFETLVPGAAGLNLLAAVSIGAVAPAGYLACRELLPQTRVGAALAAVLGVAVLLSPPMQEAAWSGFHPEEMALPLLLLATWAALRGHWVLALPLLGAVLLAKEDQAYEVAVLGLLLVSIPGRRRAGGGLLVVATAWTAMIFLVVMPWIRHGGSTDTGSYYGWLVGGGPGAIFSGSRVAAVTASLASGEAWRSVALTIVALCLLPLLQPRFLLLALPPAFAAVLSRHQPQPHLQLQYGLPIVYPLLLAAALGGKRLLSARAFRPGLAWAALLPALAVAVSGTLVVPMTRSLARPGPSRTGALTRATAKLPASIEVDVDDSVAAALASRSDLHLLPHLADTAFVVVDTRSRPPGYADTVARARVVAELPLRRPLLSSEGGIQLWGPTR
ncbi:MAG: hypothetical protein NVSMB17_04440 [Candidatus Dormibacteria bacterium]